MERPAILPSRFTGSPWNPTPAQAGGHSVHVARDGDTLETIAHQYGAPVEAVRQVNPQIRDTGNVASGESINLPSGYNAPVQGGSTSSFPIDSGSQMHGGATNLPAGSGPPAFGGSTSVPVDAGLSGHGGLLDLPINLGAPPRGAPVDYSIDPGLPTHTAPVDPPPSFQPGSPASPPNALPADTAPHLPDVPRGDSLPRDTSPPPGTPLPRNDSAPAGANTAKADTASTNPLPTTASDPRGSVVRTDPSGAFPATDKTALATTNAARTATGGEANVPARAQAALSMLAAPLAALPSSNGAMRGDAAVPLRSFEGAAPPATMAKDIPQSAGAERREMPRSTEADARAMPQARNESEKMLNYDAARLLRDVQARILSDPRAPADVPARASNDPNAKATDKNANATTPAQAGLDDPSKRLGMPGAERDPRLAVRRAGDSSWLLDWAAQLAQIRRAYARSRTENSVDLLTTAAVIGTGVALLAGLFALYALYKYWAPH